ARCAPIRSRSDRRRIPAPSASRYRRDSGDSGRRRRRTARRTASPSSSPSATDRSRCCRLRPGAPPSPCPTETLWETHPFRFALPSSGRERFTGGPGCLELHAGLEQRAELVVLVEALAEAERVVRQAGIGKLAAGEDDAFLPGRRDGERPCRALR